MQHDEEESPLVRTDRGLTQHPNQQARALKSHCNWLQCVLWLAKERWETAQKLAEPVCLTVGKLPTSLCIAMVENNFFLMQIALPGVKTAMSEVTNTRQGVMAGQTLPQEEQ